MHTSQSIAVLPFVNRSADAAQEYFCDGMTEELINALSNIQGLKVSSRTSVFRYKNKAMPLPEIGRQLGVEIMLEGSIRVAGNRMRLSTQLVDVAEDASFWTQTFDRRIDDLFAVQDEVSLLIADQLREQLGHLEFGEQLVPEPGISVFWYKKYLEGRFYLMKLNEEGSNKGIEILKEVVAAAPDFTPAYLALNQCYAFLGTMGLIPNHEAYALAQPYLEKAIALSPESAEVQLHLAWIAVWQHWDIQAGFQHLAKAIDTRPTDEIYLTLSNLFAITRQFEAAHTYVDKALQLDPFAPMNHHFKGYIYYLEEAYEQAIECQDKSLQLKPDLGYALFNKGACLMLKGNAQQALAYFEALGDELSTDLVKVAGITLSQIFLGDTATAQTGLQQLEAKLESQWVENAYSYLILCRIALGQKQEALDMIEQGIQKRYPMMLLLYTEPLAKPLFSEPAFQKMMQQAMGETTKLQFPQRKYKKALLDQAAISQHKQALEQLMLSQKPYLDPALSLRSLAQLLDLPPNYLSQLLNEGFQQNFSEFVNSYRLEAFKANAQDSDFQHLTLLALAYESGFNSKTVFNTFFKKKMGMTPSAYWRGLKKR